jgi:hypothetical protein
MKGFKKDGKFRPTGNKSKSSLKKSDIRKKQTVSKPKVIGCNECGKPFTDEKKLNHHLIHGHKPVRSKQSLDSSFDFNNPEIEDGRKTKEIMIGKESEGDFITLKIDVDGDYFSVSGSTFDDDIFSFDEGLARAREDLEEGELWRMSVEAGTTERSLDDWVEDVLNIDGWEHVLGDVIELGDDKYTMSSGGGQIDVSHKLNKWDKLVIDPKDLKTIIKAWKNNHIKNFDDIDEKGKKEIVDAVEVFRKYKTFEDEDLNELVEKDY